MKYKSGKIVESTCEHEKKIRKVFSIIIELKLDNTCVVVFICYT